jgi:hypothetical protein
MKVVSLDEYRKAKLWYHNLRSKYPDIRVSFRAFCIFRTRYSGYIKAMRIREENFSKNLSRARK